MRSCMIMIWVNKKTDLSSLGIDDIIIQTLIKENNISEKDAIDLYFSSKAYKQLTDETANLSDKSWEEIYELLKQESSG